MDFRTKKLLTHVNRAGAGLEIGPSYNPVTPKAAGWNVKIADHLTAKDLRAKYQAWQVDVSKVEEVDYVLDGSGLSGIDAAQAFDWIIASHVIEHSPDLVRFLQDCSRLLKPSGVLSLAVPDKRYCFDYFQSLTSTGMVLDAYWSGRQRHSPGNMFDTYANHVSKGGVIAWSPTSDGKLATVHTLQEAKESWIRRERHSALGPVALMWRQLRCARSPSRDRDARAHSHASGKSIQHVRDKLSL